MINIYIYIYIYGLGVGGFSFAFPYRSEVVSSGRDEKENDKCTSTLITSVNYVFSV